MNQSCWIITDEGKIGTENQCVGLAEALGFSYTLKRVSAKWPWVHLPASLWVHPLKCLTKSLMPPWPSLIIGAGRVSAAPVAYIRKIASGKTKVIQILNPYLSLDNYDVVIVPEHDQINGKNVLTTVGALNKLTQDILNQGAHQFEPFFKNLPRPLIVVLIGGSNKAYTLDEAVLETLIDQLKTLIKTQGVGLAITISRRTGEAATQKIRQAFKGLPVFIWEGIGPNPYFGFLAKADFILVTEDSVSMASEACFTGKPVYIVPLKGHSAKFDRFHQSLRDKGYTRLFKGELDLWSSPPLQETQRIAQELKEKWGIYSVSHKISIPIKSEE